MPAPAGRERRARNRGGFGGGHENHERWLLPYADMITLLLALFVVLYAMSSVNNSKASALQQSVNKAFNGKSPVLDTQGSQSQPAKAPISGAPKSDKLLSSGDRIIQLQQAVMQAAAAKTEQDKLDRVKRKLDAYARSHNLRGKVKTTIENRGLTIRLVADKVLFDSGRANLKPGSYPLLTQITGLLHQIPNQIRIEGHTDSNPINTAQFPTNWELSAIRSTTVARFLISRGMNERRLGAAGYAAEHPVASNRTAAGRAANRRVEIVVLREEKTAGQLRKAAQNLSGQVAEGISGPSSAKRAPVRPNIDPFK